MVAPWSLSGWPPAVYERRTRPYQDPTPQELSASSTSPGTSVVQVVPQDGSQNIAGLANYDFSISGTYKILRVVVDMPSGVIGRLEIDGMTVMRSDDGDGFIGSLDVGDAAAGIYLSGRSVRLTGTNQLSNAKDVRAWLVLLP